mgnify:CR=1
MLSLQLIDKHGHEAERHLFHSLFSSVDFAADNKSSGKDFQQVGMFLNEWGNLIHFVLTETHEA